MELSKRIEELNRRGIIFSFFISITILLTLPIYFAYPPILMATGDSVNPEPMYQLPEWFAYALIVLLPAAAISAYALPKAKKPGVISLIFGVLFLLLLFGVLIFDFSAFLFNFAQDWSLPGIIFKALVICQFIWTLLTANSQAKRVYYDISGCPPPKEGTMIKDKSGKDYSVKYKSNMGKLK